MDFMSEMTFWRLESAGLSESDAVGIGGCPDTFGLGAAALPGRDGRLPAAPPPRPRDELERRFVDASEACESESRFPDGFGLRLRPEPRPPWPLLPPLWPRLLPPPRAPVDAPPSFAGGLGSDMSSLFKI